MHPKSDSIPDDAIQKNAEQRAYVLYLIDQYKELAVAYSSNPKAVAINLNKAIRKQFGTKAVAVSSTRFEALCTFLKGRINNTPAATAWATACRSARRGRWSAAARSSRRMRRRGSSRPRGRSPCAAARRNGSRPPPAPSRTVRRSSSTTYVCAVASMAGRGGVRDAEARRGSRRAGASRAGRCRRDLRLVPPARAGEDHAPTDAGRLSEDKRANMRARPGLKMPPLRVVFKARLVDERHVRPLAANALPSPLSCSPF